jgi:hypothetical protein
MDTIGQEQRSVKVFVVEPEPEAAPIEKAKEIDVGQGEPPLAPKEQKKWLLGEIDKAIKKAGTEKAIEDPGYITFHVPGDGDFTIINTKESLKDFHKRAKSTFPERFQAKIPTSLSFADENIDVAHRVSLRPASTSPSQKRLSGEGVEYYNQFQPRKKSALIEGAHRAYVDGFYTDGSYMVKVAKSKVKKSLDADYLPDIPDLIDAGKKAVPAVMVGEYKTEFAEEPLSHAMTADEEIHVEVDPKYIDNVLTLHPGAKPFINPDSLVLYFKEGDEVVGLVMPRRTEGQELEQVVPGQFTKRYLKIKTPAKAPTGQASVGKFAKTPKPEGGVPKGHMRLYRASEDAETVSEGSSWTKDYDGALAYTDNPGYGGSKIWKIDVPEENILDITEGQRNSYKLLAEAYLDYEGGDYTKVHELADEWDGYGYSHIYDLLERNPEVAEQLVENGHDWVTYFDDFPDGLRTYFSLKDFEKKSEVVYEKPLPAPERKIEKGEYDQLKDVKVSVKGIREKTGDKITVRMNAKKALEKIDKNIELLNKIVECIE